MIQVQIDEQEVRKLYLQKLEEKVSEYDAELIFWDRKELEKRTCMSWNTMQKEFFFDPRFPKSKIGNKWYFPAQKVKAFLLEWLSDQ